MRRSRALERHASRSLDELGREYGREIDAVRYLARRDVAPAEQRTGRIDDVRDDLRRRHAVADASLQRRSSSS